MATRTITLDPGDVLTVSVNSCPPVITPPPIITPPPVIEPPIVIPPIGSHEPVGHLKLVEWDMSPSPITGTSDHGETDNFANGWSANYSRDINPGRFHHSTDTSAPRTPPNIGVQRFPKGMGGGGSPAIVSHNIPNSLSQLYLAASLKYSSNWVGHGDSEVNKSIYIASNEGGYDLTVYLSAQGRGSNQLHPEVHNQSNYGGETKNYVQNIGAAKYVNRGSYQLWELILKANTGGLANGVIQLWLDGIPIMNHTNVRFFKSTAVWTQVQWSPVWGGNGETIPADQFQYLDHLYISGK